LRPGDRSTEAIFSDGAAAVLVTREAQLEITCARHFTMGDKRSLLYQHTTTSENDGYLHMSGREIWAFTRMHVVAQIKEVIAHCERDQIQHIFIHQASKLVVDGIEQELGLPGKLPRNFAEVGNTVSSSIPILLKNYLPQLSRGTSILSGFGVGLTSSTIALQAL
jgi:3-oxoacyl-[acyl-carrier-protein] synthase-3